MPLICAVSVHISVYCVVTWMPTTKAAWPPAKLGVSRLALPGTVLKAVSLALRITVPWTDVHQVSLQPRLPVPYHGLQEEETLQAPGPNLVISKFTDSA